jgi:hypothetical protein
MLNRWSLLLLMLGVITGYLISGTSVRAQNDPLPFAVGDRVTLRYRIGPSSGGDQVECSVMDIRGIYVKCAPPARAAQNIEHWHSLEPVLWVQKHQ